MKKKTETLFPISIFFSSLFFLLLMAGIHTGIIVGMNKLGWGETAQVVIPLLYWCAIASAITGITRYKIKQVYDKPLKRLAEATKAVAGGDFSIYVAPQHQKDNADYLDVMINDFNKMVADLGSIETLKTDFFASVSHEFKTPLAVIQSYATILKQENLSEEKKMECTNAIVASTQKLSSLITNILKLSKLENQTVIPKSEPFDLSKQLCESVLLFEESWGDINLIVDIEDSVWIATDKSLLELVWNNLISNAIKFSPSKGTIRLSQIVTEEKIIVSVADMGCGMDKEVKKRIFDKFYQGDSSRATDGSGLGLALVLRVLQLLDCSILVESEPQKGSLFTVEIPASLIRKGV
ncbi:MAG: ATP-binding protein [Anaerorhabdus sp.]